MDKRFNRPAALFMAFILVLCTAVMPRQALAAGFTDVDSKTPHFEDIEWMRKNGLSTGFEDGSFRPYANIARCDMAAFLYRLAGEPSYTPNATDKAMFSDVDSSTPHAKEVWWLAHMGISTGFGDGTFRPYEPVARCDMSAFLYRLAFSPTYKPTSLTKAAFSDVDASTPHANEIWWLAFNGISTGFEDGTFRPYESVARCDMAAFLHRMDTKGLIDTDKYDAIEYAEDKGCTFYTGTLRILSLEELCELQGTDAAQYASMTGLSPTKCFYAVLVFDDPVQFYARYADSSELNKNEASMVMLAKREVVGSTTVTYGNLSLWEPYDGVRITVGIDGSDTFWPSDPSLPVGEPRTDSALFLFAN